MRAKLNFLLREKTYFSVLYQIQNVVESNNFADALENVNAKSIKSDTKQHELQIE